MEAAARNGALRPWMLLLWLISVVFFLEPFSVATAAAFPFPIPFLGSSYTNQQDVDAMNELYSSLGSPPDLHGWSASGGDPCDDNQPAWQGVRCLGPNITAIELRGAGLEGKLSDALGKLTAMTTLDLSWNNLSGELPGSMQNLRSLSSLRVQNNQLSGTLDVLRDLPLEDLDVENNRFSGSIPEKLLELPKFLGSGNNFTGSSPAPATATSSPPPSAHPRITVIPAAVTPQDADRHGRKVSPAKAAGLSVLAAGSLGIAVLVTVLAASNRRRRRRRESSVAGGIVETAHPSPLKNNTISVPTTVVASDGRRSPRRPLEFFTVASLQQFTDSFSDEKNLMRETRFGKVYLAEHPEGKFAVLNLRGDTSGGAALPAGEFVKKVARIAGLAHPNVEELVGCCVEHGQRPLVYRHFSDRTLDDVIHTDGGDGDPGLPWDARVAVVLQAAKALEHLHEGGGGRGEEPGKKKVVDVVVHGHFGAEHVLVDGEGRVRVSGCGLAQFAALPSGTPDWRGDGHGHGEQPPEEAMADDVYGLGVVMLQLLTGRRPHDGGWRLVPWAGARLHDMSALRRMADPRLLLLRGTAAPVPVRSLSRFADIISRCLQPEAEFRPVMSQVVQDLRRAMEEARAVAAV